jgi:undecaprenyl-diphosphatase
MPWWMAALLGLVEGLTEYLPVSSTGHLIVVGEWLRLHDDATKDFDVVIQAGAVLAVLVHYRALLAERARGLLQRDPRSTRLVAVVFAAFLPAALAGFALRKSIKAHLFGPKPVVAALLIGGVAMIVIERLLAKREDHGESAEAGYRDPPAVAPRRPRIDRLEDVDVPTAFKVGLAQCLALWPGASRSMCTILGGRLLGLSNVVAAELSFLVALPLLGAATALDLWKGRHGLLGDPAMRSALVIGLVTSFFVAWAVIGWFLRVLQRRGLAPFGWYRIAFACVVLVSTLRG